LPVKPWQMTFVFLSIRMDMSLQCFRERMGVKCYLVRL
jgi:hypothetical protein